MARIPDSSQRIAAYVLNPAMNNMFIVEPFMGFETLTNLFATHPPIEKRIAALLGG